MEKQKKSYGKTALIVLLLIVTIASLVLATYAWAKYSSLETGTGTAKVAKWDVNVDINETTNQLEEEFKHVLADRLAPGMSGSFEIDINPGQTEVDFHYEIILDKLVVVDDDGSEQSGKSVPAHLHFYTKESHTNNDEIFVDPNTGEQETQKTAKDYLQGNVIVVDPDTGAKKEQIEVVDPDTGEKKNPEETLEGGKLKKVIYWEWPYENPNKQDNGVITDSQTVTNDNGTAKLTSGTNGIDDYDDQDTVDGMNAYKVQVQFRVITTQIKPGEKV